jgi:AAA+ superfamily predicted ATPase
MLKTLIYISIIASSINLQTECNVEKNITIHTLINKCISFASTRYSQIRNWLTCDACYQRYKFKPRYTFDDVSGLDHAKQALDDILKYISDPENYDQAGLNPIIGYFMFGPSRTGKSMIAEALAGEIEKIKGTSDDFPFFEIHARYIAAEGNFQAVMNTIKNYAPCIIFIDEIDILPGLRDKNNKENTPLQEFLSTISDCMINNNPEKKIIIIAATNGPNKLDPSVRSLFPVHIPFEFPSFMERSEYLISKIEKKGLPIEQFDISKLTEQTEGFPFQFLDSIINDAQFFAREQDHRITQADIEKSLNIFLNR